MATIKDLYIFLSSGENYIQSDVDSLISKKIVNREEISNGDSLLVCISRDYFDLPNPTPAIMIRDQLSNVFCPKWRINSIRYPSLNAIMYLEETYIPDIYVITNDKEIYDNMDYYLHLNKFSKRNKLYLPKYKEGFSPIKSNIGREDILMLGQLTVRILEMAKYDDVNSQVPGWIFQCANGWMTRLLDLYDVKPNINLLPKGLSDLRLTREEFIKDIETPIIMDGHKVGEDIRTSIIESYEVRKTLYELSRDLVEKLE